MSLTLTQLQVSNEICSLTITKMQFRSIPLREFGSKVDVKRENKINDVIFGVLSHNTLYKQTTPLKLPNMDTNAALFREIGNDARGFVIVYCAFLSTPKLQSCIFLAFTCFFYGDRS